MPGHRHPPPRLPAHSLTHSPHRCPAGNPKAAGCLDTECLRPSGPPAHSCLRRVEPPTPRAACTHGARVPLGPGHPWEQSRAQGWETPPPTCPEAAERCQRHRSAGWLLPAQGKAVWRLVRESARDTLTCSQGPPRQRWHFSRLDTQGLTVRTVVQSRAAVPMWRASAQSTARLTLTPHSPRFHPTFDQKTSQAGLWDKTEPMALKYNLSKAQVGGTVCIKNEV